MFERRWPHAFNFWMLFQYSLISKDPSRFSLLRYFWTSHYLHTGGLMKKGPSPCKLLPRNLAGGKPPMHPSPSPILPLPLPRTAGGQTLRVCQREVRSVLSYSEWTGMQWITLIEQIHVIFYFRFSPVCYFEEFLSLSRFRFSYSPSEQKCDSVKESVPPPGIKTVKL